MDRSVENVVKLRDAFGVGRDVPLNYVTRPEVDGKFIESFTRDKHVVIYGSSKQGKTTLRRHVLDQCVLEAIIGRGWRALDEQKVGVGKPIQ